MPPDKDGNEIPVDWTVIRIEEHLQTKMIIGYHYLCPNCTFTLLPKQTTLTALPKQTTLAEPQPSPSPPSEQTVRGNQP